MVYIVVDHYNNTIHSVTKVNPSDVFFNRNQKVNYQNVLIFQNKLLHNIEERIKNKQNNRNHRINKKIKPI